MGKECKNIEHGLVVITLKSPTNFLRKDQENLIFLVIHFSLYDYLRIKHQVLNLGTRYLFFKEAFIKILT